MLYINHRTKYMTLFLKTAPTLTFPRISILFSLLTLYRVIGLDCSDIFFTFKYILFCPCYHRKKCLQF